MNHAVRAPQHHQIPAVRKDRFPNLVDSTGLYARDRGPSRELNSRASDTKLDVGGSPSALPSYHLVLRCRLPMLSVRSVEQEVGALGLFRVVQHKQ